MSILPTAIVALSACISACLLVDRVRARRRLARLIQGIQAPPCVPAMLDFDSFDEALSREVDRAMLLGSHMAVAYVEVCGISELRASQGQRIAADVCATVGGMLGAGRVGTEIVARIATDTFGVLIPDCDRAHAGMRFQRLLDDMRAILGDVRISIGMAMSDGFSSEDIEQAAERALFAAHELGSDRLLWYGEQVEQVLAGSADRRQSSRAGQLATVLRLAETLDLRDADTSEHSHNVSRYCELMARGLGLPLAEVERIRIAGLLHDIGKIGIPDSVLSKPAKLDDAEWKQMQQHPEIGARILDGLGADDIRGWVLAHHERPDGRGYPHGLTDAEIPLAAKILAVADSYEAMTADRVYRAAPGPEFARSELLKWRGAQFDEAVVEVFLRELDAIESARDGREATLADVGVLPGLVDARGRDDGLAEAA